MDPPEQIRSTQVKYHSTFPWSQKSLYPWDPLSIPPFFLGILFPQLPELKNFFCLVNILSYSNCQSENYTKLKQWGNTMPPHDKPTIDDQCPPGQF